MILLLDTHNHIGATIKYLMHEKYGMHTFEPDDGDLNDSGFLRYMFETHQPKIFINTCEYESIDGSEFFRGDAYYRNSFIVNKIALLCAKYNVLFVNFSSVHIFNGKKKEPYSESDEADPINVYGDSKNLGERFIRETGCRYLILRLGDVYGSITGLLSRSFVKKVGDLSVQVVKGQIISPVYVVNVVYALCELLDRNYEGVVNVCQEGVVPAGEFLKEALDLYVKHTHKKYDLQVEEVFPKGFVTSYELPFMNALDNTKYFEITGQKMRHWSSALDDFFKNGGVF